MVRIVTETHRTQVIKTMQELLALDYRKSRKDTLDKLSVLIHDVRVALDIPLEAIFPPTVSNVVPAPVSPLESELHQQTQIP